MNDIKQQLSWLAGELDSHAAVLASEVARGSVWGCAVGALVRTHPDPSAFAAEFRRMWHLAGAQQSNTEVLHAAQKGYADALALLERGCPAPLGVRPPGVAREPDAG